MSVVQVIRVCFFATLLFAAQLVGGFEHWGHRHIVCAQHQTVEEAAHHAPSASVSVQVDGPAYSAASTVKYAEHVNCDYQCAERREFDASVQQLHAFVDGQSSLVPAAQRMAVWTRDTLLRSAPKNSPPASFV